MVQSSIVSWSDHNSFLLSGLRELFASGHNSDLEIKCGDRSFRVHKLIVNLFTDYFKACDGLWVRVNAEAAHVENVLKFLYQGQVTVDYNEMEGFLLTCKLLAIKLFKDAEETPDDQVAFQERYELNDFQLMCRNCYKCFPDEKVLKKHIWGCTREKTLQCKFCSKKFRFRFDVQHHELSHTGEKPFKCSKEGCSRAFKLKNGLILHVKSEHENVRYRCSDCEMEFKSTTGLKAHKATIHTTERPWGCMECGKACATKTQLQSHQKNSHGKKAKKDENLT